MQCPLDASGIARDDGEVGFGRLVGLRSALFPIPQSSKRDSESSGKFLLGQREGAAKRFDTRNAAQFPGRRIGKRQVVAVASGGRFDFRSAHGSQRRNVQRFFAAVGFNTDQRAVTSHSRDSRGLAHF